MNEQAPKETSADLKKVTQFFEQRQALLGCPCCGTRNWTLIEIENQQLGIAMRQLDGGFVVPPPMVPAYVLACDNCGFLRAHARAVVDSG